MLTPQFELEQFDNYILVTVTAPYIKTNDVEIYMEDNEFKFYVKPYFLRLYFPCDVIEDGRESAEYDIPTGIFKIQVPKKNDGEYFPNLDMLTTLLATKKKNLMKPIEVIEPDGKSICEDGEMMSNSKIEDGDNEDADEIDEDGLCWEVEQELFKPADILTGFKYGFANKVNGVFIRLQSELHETIDSPHPDNTSLQDRRELRTKEENIKFDADHYIADLMEDDYIHELLSYKSQWDVEYDRILLAQKTSYPETSGLISPKANPMFFTEEEGFVFTNEEKNILLQLANKDYLLSKQEEHMVFLSLLDVIFAYAYNYRTTEGDNTSESAWTISKISATLSWMDSFKNIPDVLTSCTRRCLCYPLYRHWLLINKVVSDVRRIFLLGRRWILRCLLDVRVILQGDESKYILNDLYINDLCIWIQKVKRKKITSLANKLQCSKIEKCETSFNLEEIERKAYATQEGKSDSSEDEETSSGSTEESTTESSDDSDTSSLDSDDDISNVNKENSGNTCSNTTVPTPSKPLIEVLQSKGEKPSFTNEVEIIRTGLEELMTVQRKFVEGTGEEEAEL